MSLADWPHVYFDQQITFTISNCIVSSFYADFPLDPETSVSRGNLLWEVPYVLGEFSITQYSFTDFIISQGSSSCGTDFIQTYTLTANNGEDISFITFDPEYPDFVVNLAEGEIDKLGTYWVTVSAKINSVPEVTASTHIVFKIVVVGDPCLSSEMISATIEDMVFDLGYKSLSFVFDEIEDTLT
mgnify:CR=1 FL=1